MASHPAALRALELTLPQVLRSNSRESSQEIPNFAIFHFPLILGCWTKEQPFSPGTNMSTETNISALHTERCTGTAERSTFKVLLAVSICHLLNDTVQSLLPALFILCYETPFAWTLAKLV